MAAIGIEAICTCMTTMKEVRQLTIAAEISLIAMLPYAWDLQA